MYAYTATHSVFIFGLDYFNRFWSFWHILNILAEIIDFKISPFFWTN